MGIAGGGPVNNTDTSGHSIWSALKGVIGFAGARNYVKPTFTHFKYIQEIMPDIYVAQEMMKGKTSGKRLVVSGHGNYDKDVGGFVGSSGRRVMADELWSHINERIKKIDLDSISSIKVVACMSGSGEAHSLASQLSKLSGLPVKGYEGTVHAFNAPHQFAQRYRELTGKNLKLDRVYKVRRHDVISKNNPYDVEHVELYRSFHFNPKVFYPD